MSPVHDREKQAFRAAFAAMVEDTPPPPQWDDIRLTSEAVPAPVTRRAAVFERLAASRSVPVQRGAAKRRGWAVALAWALVTLVVVGGGVLLLGGGSDQSVVDEPEPPPDMQSLEWTMAELGEPLVGSHGETLTSISAGGPGFVAVGGALCPDTSACYETAAVWTSIDGTGWSRVPHDPEVFGGASGETRMEDVTAGGPGLVAVGGGFDEPDRPGLFAVVWVSEDGQGWSRIPSDRSVFGSHDPDEPGSGQTWLRSVTVGGPGFVAVGSDAWAAAVWTSPDGINWDRVPHDPQVFGAGEMSAVTVGGPGLVAVGNADGSSAAVWVSTDGFAWTRVPHDEAVFGGVGSQVMHDIVAGGPGLVAVGGEEPDIHRPMGGIRAAIWTSPDGFTWIRVPHDAEVFGGEAGNEGDIVAVASIGSEMYATGGLGSVSPAVWGSVDGLTWTRVPFDASISKAPEPLAPERWGVNDVSPTSTGLIAVGQEDGAAAVWVATKD